MQKTRKTPNRPFTLEPTFKKQLKTGPNWRKYSRKSSSVMDRGTPPTYSRCVFTGPEMRGVVFEIFEGTVGVVFEIFVWLEGLGIETFVWPEGDGLEIFVGTVGVMFEIFCDSRRVGFGQLDGLVGVGIEILSGTSPDGVSKVSLLLSTIFARRSMSES